MPFKSLIKNKEKGTFSLNFESLAVPAAKRPALRLKFCSFMFTAAERPVLPQKKAEQGHDAAFLCAFFFYLRSYSRVAENNP